MHRLQAHSRSTLAQLKASQAAAASEHTANSAFVEHMEQDRARATVKREGMERNLSAVSSSLLGNLYVQLCVLQRSVYGPGMSQVK